MTAPVVTSEHEPAPAPARNPLAAAFRDYVARVRGGDVGSLPAVLGLIVLVMVFSVLRPETFTNAFNFANLIHQAAAVIVIAMGLVFVLLLGEIDLSAGYAAGTAAAVMGIASTNWGWPWWLAILACLATGAVIGTFIGLLVARLGIPSFVVTLATFLGSAGRAAPAHRRGRHDPDPRPDRCWRSTTTTCRSGSAGRCTRSSWSATRPRRCAAAPRGAGGPPVRGDRGHDCQDRHAGGAARRWRPTTSASSAAGTRPSRRSRACRSWSRSCWCCWSA